MCRCFNLCVRKDNFFDLLCSFAEDLCKHFGEHFNFSLSCLHILVSGQVQGKNIAVVKALVDAKADVDARTHKGNTPLRECNFHVRGGFMGDICDSSEH